MNSANSDFASRLPNPPNRTPRGAIYFEQAYAQGKMLQSAGWTEILPRNITPSDVDLFFDNRGEIILCEFTSSLFHWKEASVGQRIGYWNLIRGTTRIAILCKHSVPRTRQIDTVRDVESICVMYDAGDSVPAFRAFPSNDCWRKIVGGWYKHGAEWVRDRL